MDHDQHLSSACRLRGFSARSRLRSRDRWCRLGCLSCTRQIWKSSKLICVFCGRLCCCGPNGIRRLTCLLQLLLIKTNPKECPELPIMKVRRITCIDVWSTLRLKWCRRMALLAETKAIDRHDARSVRSRTRKNVNKCLPWSGSDRFPNHDTLEVQLIPKVTRLKFTKGSLGHWRTTGCGSSPAPLPIWIGNGIVSAQLLPRQRGMTQGP